MERTPGGEGYGFARALRRYSPASVFGFLLLSAVALVPAGHRGRAMAQAGSPYVNLNISNTALDTGKTVKVTLLFQVTARRARIAYRPRLLVGPAPR